ncbi:MAG: DUF4827 domain-containing protein [Bacteroidaceae bacterium]|jgi:hypothetical protein
MKKYLRFLLPVLLLPICCASCDDTKTYADLLEDEENYINDFIAARGYRIINENDFDPARKMADNEFVLFSASGLYLHIDSLGEGPTLYHVLDSLTKVNTGYRMQITVRFLEYSLSANDTIVTNFYTNASPEQFYYAKGSSTSGYSSSNTYYTYGSFFASDDQTETATLMRTYYGTAVPGGWLLPLQYVGDGGRVKIIVPSDLGHTSAQANVLPYYYEIYYNRYN